ncbi:hypothetical protein ASC94_25785 [Massilia sp. Root418]|jgi:hypothetical protein|uniref:hypothetical protein n=1 Tax=Massilia sp. Root418 TaxID=1736532 RepID=UPI0006FBFEC3|nr:hypothetical protein [Massilia sp. Root418]KQW87906.1 hypothetical protein ASC94_25785 [Massilia sp. Root418]
MNTGNDQERLQPAEPAPRSEGLLPAGEEEAAEDEVAEEVSLDQQSGKARRVGHPPADGPGKPADALAETLKR